MEVASKILTLGVFMVFNGILIFGHPSFESASTWPSTSTSMKHNDSTPSSSPKPTMSHHDRHEMQPLGRQQRSGHLTDPQSGQPRLMGGQREDNYSVMNTNMRDNDDAPTYWSRRLDLEQNNETQNMTVWGNARRQKRHVHVDLIGLGHGYHHHFPVHFDFDHFDDHYHHHHHHGHHHHGHHHHGHHHHW